MLVLVFTLTLLLFKGLDVSSVEDIKLWYKRLKNGHMGRRLIIALLMVDLFIAIPTLSLTILSGFFRIRDGNPFFLSWIDVGWIARLFY